MSDKFYRFPEVKDPVVQIGELFKQQMSARQVKKYEAALYLARIQELGLSLLHGLQDDLKNAVTPAEVEVIRNKFDACNSLQKVIFELKSADYEKGLPLYDEMKAVLKDKTDKAALKVFETYPRIEQNEPKAEPKKAATEKPKAKKTAAPKTKKATEASVDFEFVEDNVLGVSQSQAASILNILKALQEKAA